MGTGKGICPERSQLPGNKQHTGHKLYFYSSTAPQRHTLNPHFIFPVVTLLLIFHPSGQPAINPFSCPVSRFGLHFYTTEFGESSDPENPNPNPNELKLPGLSTNQFRPVGRRSFVSTATTVEWCRPQRETITNNCCTTPTARRTQSIQAKAATCLRSTRPYLTRIVLVSKTV